MRVYLAAPSAELPRVFSAVRSLGHAGFHITERWFDKIEADRGSLTSDVGVPDETLARAWNDNMRGVLVAESLLVLCKTGGGLSNGAREEVAAFCFDRHRNHEARGGRVVVVGDLGSSPTCGWLRWAALSMPTRVRIVGTVAAAIEALR